MKVLQLEDNTTTSIDFGFLNNLSENTMSTLFCYSSNFAEEDNFFQVLRTTADEFDDVLKRLAD